MGERLSVMCSDLVEANFDVIYSSLWHEYQQPLVKCKERHLEYFERDVLDPMASCNYDCNLYHLPCLLKVLFFTVSITNPLHPAVLNSLLRKIKYFNGRYMMSHLVPYLSLNILQMSIERKLKVCGLSNSTVFFYLNYTLTSSGPKQ